MKKLSVDVLNINGSLDKNNKFWWIRLFCDNYHSRRGNFCALVTSNASNIGIDKHSISLQVHFEWPRDLLTYFQERGRGSRIEGAVSSCVLFADLVSYIHLMSQLLTSSSSEEETALKSNNIEGFNSAILPGRQSRPRIKRDRRQYALGPTAKHSLRERSTSELRDVLRFFCLNLGCQQSSWQMLPSKGMSRH